MVIIIQFQITIQKQEIAMKNKNAETMLKTDKAIFYYVWQEMKKQGEKGMDTYTDDETGEEMPGDSMKYFGWSPTRNTSTRCALGFIMNRGLADENDIENQTADDVDVITLVMRSNPEWKFTSSSADMIWILQQIHDRYLVEDWDDLFEMYSKEFDEDGNFIAFKQLRDSGKYMSRETGIELETESEDQAIHLVNKTVYLNLISTCAMNETLDEKMEEFKAARDKKIFNVDTPEMKKEVKNQDLMINI